MARKLTQTYKFAARTAPELYELVNGFVVRVASGGRVKFRGRKLGAEAAINAVLMDFMDKPEEERIALLARMVPRFEALLAGAPAKNMKGFEVGAKVPKGTNRSGSR